MTPQEKAKELFTTFRYALSHKDAPLGMYKDNIAIQCALIAVGEILNNFGSRVEDKTHYCNYLTIQYYQEVKREILQL
jgi:hypothetical protein